MNRILIAALALLAFHYNSVAAGVPDSAEIVHQWNRAIIEVIMEDGFGPPIAARIHAFTSLAGYQAARHASPGNRSLVGTLNAFKDCPEPVKGQVYDWRVAAVAAFQTSSSKLLYRIYITDSLAKSHFAALEAVVPKEVFDRSKAYGTDVGKAINAYAKTDGFARTQGLPDWEWPHCDSCWEPTPPNFAKPMSPYCGLVRTMSLKSADQIPLEPPTKFSLDRSSEFYKATMEVYHISKNLTDDQKAAANFWNDNPVLTNYRGHFVFNSRQISPGGHWFNIATQVMREDKTSMVKALEVYSMMSIALFDAFTACWDQKYKHNLIRPVTYINKLIDKNWEPMLQTPPFPEHASGHSTITGAAAEVLTHYFGERPFADSTEVMFGWPVRSFPNFRAAAIDASNSRLYGGIHYRIACDAANRHGIKIGQYVIENVRYRE